MTSQKKKSRHELGKGKSSFFRISKQLTHRLRDGRNKKNTQTFYTFSRGGESIVDSLPLAFPMNDACTIVIVFALTHPHARECAHGR